MHRKAGHPTSMIRKVGLPSITDRGRSQAMSNAMCKMQLLVLGKAYRTTALRATQLRQRHSGD